MRKGETCARSWYKNDVIGTDEKGCPIYNSELYCWGHKLVKDENGETRIITIPLKPCDDCDDMYIKDIGP